MITRTKDAVMMLTLINVAATRSAIDGSSTDHAMGNARATSAMLAIQACVSSKAQ